MKILFACSNIFLASLAHASMLLQGAHVIDPKTQTSSVRDLLVDHGQIVRSSTRITPSDDMQVIPLAGKWIVPSFFDAHTHTFGFLAPGGSYHHLGLENASELMLYAGVTGYLDLFNHETDVFPFRDRQRKGHVGGADLYAAGPCLTAPNAHCSEYAAPTRIVESPEGAWAEVRELAKLKPDVIKLVYDHVFLPTMSKETMEAVISEAARLNIKTVVHVGNWQDVRDVVHAGANAITHTSWEDLPRDLAILMAAKGTVAIPTVAVQSDIANIVENPSFLLDSLLQAMTPKKILDDYEDPNLEDPVLQAYLEYARRSRPALARNIPVYASANVTLLAGTDIPNLGTFVGYSVHREMELMVQYGLSPMQALAAASTNPSAFLGLNYGLAEGNVANLVVLHRSPLEAISNTKSIAMVLHKGRWVNRQETLRKVYGSSGIE